MLTYILTRALALLLISALALPLAAVTPTANAKNHAKSSSVEADSAGEAEPAIEKKKKRKNVTRMFSNTESIPIPGTGDMGPANPYPATIEVSGFKKGKIKDVNLHVFGFNHGSAVDVDVLLVATHLPDRTATVLSDVGGGVASLTDLVLDDQASTPLPQVGPLGSGSYQPTNADPFVNEPIDPFPAPAPSTNGNALLGVFEGGNPNGTWQLFIVDDAVLDTGSVARGWALEITAQVKEKKKKDKKKKGRKH